jgi:hypothetical protein
VVAEFTKLHAKRQAEIGIGLLFRYYGFRKMGEKLFGVPQSLPQSIRFPYAPNKILSKYSFPGKSQ